MFKHPASLFTSSAFTDDDDDDDDVVMKQGHNMKKGHIDSRSVLIYSLGETQRQGC